MIEAPEEGGVWGFDGLRAEAVRGLTGEAAEARNRPAGRKETGNRWSVCLHTHQGMHRQSYAAEGLRPVCGRSQRQAYLWMREGFMKATSARDLARSGGRAERLMRSAAITEGKRQRRSDTNQIFAKPGRLLLAARAEAKFWTPYYKYHYHDCKIEYCYRNRGILAIKRFLS